MTADAPTHGSFVTESLVFAGRQFARWRRLPVVPIQSLLLPTLLLVTYSLLVSKSMARLTGENGLYGLVPMCAVAGAMLGALGAGLAMPGERESGLLTRFWQLPVHRASALSGTLLAEGTRTLASTVLITVVGFPLGFRFHGGWLALVPFLLVPVLVVLVYTTVVITVAVHSRARTLLTWLGTASTGLVFSSTGVAPLEIFPTWLRPLIQFQPMSPMIDSMRALAEGESPLGPMLLGAVWIVVLGVVFVPLAIRGYRAAAES
jgi:ABC-2 type transport system permease protein